MNWTSRSSRCFWCSTSTFWRPTSTAATRAPFRFAWIRSFWIRWFVLILMVFIDFGGFFLVVFGGFLSSLVGPVNCLFAIAQLDLLGTSENTIAQPLVLLTTSDHTIAPLIVIDLLLAAPTHRTPSNHRATIRWHPLACSSWCRPSFAASTCASWTWRAAAFALCARARCRVSNDGSCGVEKRACGVEKRSCGVGK